MAKIAVFAFAFVAICRAQAPPQVQGQVTSVTGEPVKNATVRLIALKPAVNNAQNPILNTYTTASDAAGNFEFESTPPGMYQIDAQHNGYLRLTGRGNNLVVTLGAGRPVTGISLKLTPEGRIEGTITNEDGDPVRDARVFILGWTASNGFKRLVMQGSGNQQLAADGTFVVGGLTAGHYYVCASLDRGGNDQPRGRSAHEAYITTYYPGTPDLSSATLIKVAAGAVNRGVNIQLQRSAVYSFRGKAINGVTNAPSEAVSISLRRDPPLLSQPRSATIKDDGSFDFLGLTPGEYAVQANYARPPAGAQPQPLPLFAPPIAIGNKDVEDGILRLIPAVQVDGKVTIEGGGAPPDPSSQDVAVSLVRDTPLRAGQMQGGKEGTFVIRNIEPGQYFPSVSGLDPGMYLKAVRFGNQDVTGKIVDLTSGVGGTLEIVLSPQAADVSGVIRDPQGNPIPQTQVSLWKPGQRSADGTFFPLVTSADQSGTFHFTNLAPGEYRVAAWDGFGAVIAPEFLSQLDDAAAVVKLEEDSHQTIEAPLIKQDAIDSAIANFR